MYQCPSCGAGLIFNPKNQMLECYYCNNTYNPKEIEKLHLQEAKGEKTIQQVGPQENQQQVDDNLNKDVYDAIVYRCTQCGAELITTDETISTFCSYCGSSAILEKRNAKKQKPNYIIPFTKTKEECEKAYRNKLKRAFFAPSNMAKDQQVEKIRGIYMPYWIYSFEKDGTQSAIGSKYAGRAGDYVYYDEYTILTNINAKCSGITHDAASNFSDSLSESIAPFSVKEKKEFSPTYLAGFYADSEDVVSDTYVDESNSIVNKQASKELMKDSIYSKYKAKPNVELEPKTAELGLFPVYFLSTKNRKGDRISYAVVNGQTGKVAADIPIDFKKYILASLILAIPIFILLNLFFTLTPHKVLILAIIFNIIILIISNKQVNKIFDRENNLEDKGYINKKTGKTIFNQKQKNKSEIGPIRVFILFFTIFLCAMVVLAAGPMGIIGLGAFLLFGMSLTSEKDRHTNKSKEKKKFSNGKDRYTNKREEKMKFSEKIKKIYKPIIGIIIAIVIFILNPVSDLFYYGGTIISIIMTIWSFYDIIKELNLLTTRKLPQLEKRGGDENA